MIMSNLKIILAQKNITISQLHSATGISRSTLTLLCNNKSGGIQFDTLDLICSYLNVLPSDIVIFSPYDIEIFKCDTASNAITVLTKNKIIGRAFSIDLPIEKERNSVWLNHFIEQESKFNDFEKVIKGLPSYYITQLDAEFKRLLSSICDVDSNDIDFSVASHIY